MSDVGGVAVAVDIGGPFELCCVCVAGADVARLEGLELLLGAELVCHSLKRVLGWNGWGSKGMCAWLCEEYGLADRYE